MSDAVLGGGTVLELGQVRLMLRIGGYSRSKQHASGCWTMAMHCWRRWTRGPLSLGTWHRARRRRHLRIEDQRSSSIEHLTKGYQDHAAQSAGIVKLRAAGRAQDGLAPPETHGLFISCIKYVMDVNKTKVNTDTDTEESRADERS